MDHTLVCETASGVYEVLRRSASVAGLELTLEAHAYLNQEDDDEILIVFLEEKIQHYGNKNLYFAALGEASFDDLEQRIVNAFIACYFRTLPTDKLKKAVRYLRLRNKFGRTIIEKIITRAAVETLQARPDYLTLPGRCLIVSFIFSFFSAYYFYVKQKWQPMLLFLGMAIASVLIRFLLNFFERRRTPTQVADGKRIPFTETHKLQQAIADMLGRFYPGFDW